MNTNIEYIHDFLESVKDDRSLYERILDDIEDGERLNNGDDKHTVYYLQLSDDANSKEKNYWVRNIRKYTNLYVYAMLFNWKEQWTADEIIKSRLESILNSFSNEIASEITRFNADTETVPSVILVELKFISDAFLWNFNKEIPHFTEEQKSNIEKYRPNYERYMTLVNGDKQEDVAKDINHYLSYCTTIDEAYKNNDCLTSFIMHLSGTGNHAVNYDAMLKSIPAESWGIDTIRQSLIKGGMNFHVDIIKLAIYSISRFTQNDTIPENDVEKRKAFVKELLDRASDDYSILKNNRTKLGVFDLLKLSRYIKDYLINNKTTVDACNDDIALAEKRNAILAELHFLISSIIDRETLDECDDFRPSGRVDNFDIAKAAMVDMIEDEQQKELFFEQEEDKLLDGITECPNHSATICRVAENCKNGKFLALFLGEYQTGKSTTIDALCDGRHISAIGDGTATSAVLVLVSYAEKESLRINWRNSEQFKPIFERIQRVMPDYAWHYFDLDKSTERKKLADAIELQRRRNDRGTLEPGDVKFLMLCDLILAYYGTEKLQAKKENLLSIYSISEITRFPKDGETKWENEGVESFTIDEALFIFIDSVACSIPSETLKRLNCTIIDSPGLFNSAYDTMVTESAMVAAHAIIYFLPYEKGIGTNVCTSLDKIKDKYHDFHSKLLIVNNLDSRKECTFAESNRKYVKKEFGADKDVYFYDARVSYLSQLKQRYDDGKATEVDYAHLMHAKLRTPFGPAQELHFQTFDDAWSFHINPYKGIYGTDDTSSAKDYLEKAGFYNMVDALKTFVEKNEAYAVLMSNGLIPMRKELVAIKRELRMRYVEPYTKSHEELTNLWNERIAKAEKFQKLVTDTVQTELFHTNKGLTVCNSISNAEYDKIFTSDFYSEIAKEIAGVLYDNKSTFIASQAMRAIRDDVSIQIFPPRLKFKNNGRFQEVFGDLASPLIKNKLLEIISYRLKNALEIIESEQDKIIDNLFSPVAKYIEKTLEQEWNTIFNGNRDFNMSNYLTVPRSLKGCIIEKEAETSGTDLISDLGIGAALVGGIVVQITAVVTGIAAMIAGYIGMILCDPTFTALIACVLLGIGGAIISFIAPDYVRDRFVDFLTERVEPKIKADASESFKELIDSQIKIILERYTKGRVVDIQKMKNQRDIALAQNPNQEAYCFRAIELILKIKKQVVAYDIYKETHIKNETI